MEKLISEYFNVTFGMIYKKTFIFFRVFWLLQISRLKMRLCIRAHLDANSQLIPGKSCTDPPLPTTAFFFWEQQECQKLNYTIILPEVIRKIRLSQTVIE